MKGGLRKSEFCFQMWAGPEKVSKRACAFCFSLINTVFLALLFPQMHLADDSFVELFKMTKKDWEGVPQWKKNQTKKALDLF